MGAERAGVEDVFVPVRAVADAVLYEGYLLYPYRRSSAKNRVRWQFGVLTPREWTRARGPEDTGVAGSAEGWWQRTECLLHGAAELQREATGLAILPFLQPLHDESVERLRTAMDPDELERAWRLGRSLPLEKLVAEALNRTSERNPLPH